MKRIITVLIGITVGSKQFMLLKTIEFSQNLNFIFRLAFSNIVQMLLTKLHIPTSDANLVQRTNLFDRLNEGLKRKLILVSANAGFGKTTVVGDWIKKHKIPSAWFSIDSNDNDPSDFLQYIIVAIQGLQPSFGEKALLLLQSPSPPGTETIVNLLINDIINIKDNFVLVLDDFHLIKNLEIFKALSHLLEYMPPNIHLVILSRSDPNLPVAKLRSQQQLIELRSADLSFTANDIATLFNKKLKTKLSLSDIKALEIKTEGWIAGLQLAALSMQGQEDTSGFINALAGNNRYIMDYLIEEVLKNQSEEVKDFLLKTSILNQISAPLCNAILNRSDSQLIIEQLENSNMFVFPLDTERHWYRYHHLFADLLKQRLLLSDKKTINNLHNNACVWFEENNFIELAINHALAINNFEKSIALIAKIVEQLWQKGMHSAILEYGKIIPDEYLHRNAEFCLYYAWVLLANGQLKKAKPFLENAKNKIQEQITEPNAGNLPNKQKLLGKIAVAFTYLYSHENHNKEIFEYVELAKKHLKEDDLFWYSWAWFSKGIANFSDGNLNESNIAFNKAFELAKKTGNIYLISTIVLRMTENEQQLGNYKAAYQKCSDLLSYMDSKGFLQLAKRDWTFAGIYFTMGISQFLWADTQKAYENIKIAYDLCKNGNDIYLKAFVLMVYTVVQKEQGNADFKLFSQELDELIENNSVPPFLTSMHLGWKIYLLTANYQLEEAKQLASDAGLSLTNKKDHTNETAYSSYANLLLIENRIKEAEPLLNELLKIATAGNRVERIIELKIAHAALYKIKGEQEKALSFIIEAMEMASKEEILSFFVFNIHEIDDLLKQVFQSHKTKSAAGLGANIPQQYINKLENVIEQKNKIKSLKKESDLSIRELDTLREIAQGLMNQEIADKLFVSINTVKTHVKNILLKLEVDNRTKAVEKAKELGLF